MRGTNYITKGGTGAELGEEYIGGDATVVEIRVRARHRRLPEARWGQANAAALAGRR